MADSASAIDKGDYGSKKTKNTKVWWQAKTGWSADEFDRRRNAIIARIRERWPEEKTLSGRDGTGGQQKNEVKEWLRPLVVSFNDTNWPYGATDQNRIERQLQYYVSWALYLNRTFHFPPGSSLQPSNSVLSTDQPTSQLNRSRLALAAQKSGYWSESPSDNETTKLDIEPESKNSSKIMGPLLASRTASSIPSFDWDDVEVRVDAHELGLGEIWLPMIDLKTTPKHSPSHWADFSLAKLYKHLSAETGVAIDPDKHRFVCLNSAEPFEFYREGAYRIMLKRFSQTPHPDKVLFLRIMRQGSQQSLATTTEQRSFYLTPPQTAPRADDYFTSSRALNLHRTSTPPHPLQTEHNSYLATLQDSEVTRSGSKRRNRSKDESNFWARSDKRQRLTSTMPDIMTRSIETNSAVPTSTSHETEVLEDQDEAFSRYSRFRRPNRIITSGRDFVMPKSAEPILFSEADSPVTEPISSSPEQTPITKVE